MVSATHQYEWASSTHVSLHAGPLPLPSLPSPSRLSQSTSFGCPASYIKLALAIYFTYGNVYVSRQIISQLFVSAFGGKDHTQCVFLLLTKDSKTTCQVSPSCKLKSLLTSLHNLGGIHTRGLIYVAKTLRGITMVTDIEADGRINWVIDLEPLKAWG